MAAYSTERRWIDEPAGRPGLTRASSSFWQTQRAPLVALLATLGLVGALGAFRTAPPGQKADDALVAALAERGLACDPADVVWIGPPAHRSWSAPLSLEGRAIVRARTNGEPSDLYAVDVRLSPERRFLSLRAVRDITDTSGVDESRPLLQEGALVYTTAADGLVTGVHVLNLAGRAPDATLTRLQRAQSALTNLQQTGQANGFAHSMYALDPVARRVALSFREDGALLVQADDHAIVLEPASGRVLAGDAYVRVVPDERARPGNLATWAVDRVRALSWFGDDRMQWVKAVVFTALDKARATFATGTTSEDVRNDLGIASSPSLAPPPIDPEIGWPPPPFVPVITPALPGEGQWIPLDQDPFITQAASGGPAAFVTSFVRPDPQRTDVRVYVTLWDPRQIALHMEAGTIEPISATGERGPGMIPRTPEVMSRVVAAFNGGFQAQHGEYGMVANGIEYLPPKPYAATVVELRDGSNGFGAWPDSGEVPADVIALRQNLTALVQNGKFNPWGRGWWGGTPPGWPDQVHSTRSAICLTKAGFEGYFYSTSISAEDLARGMLAAGCSFGIHLDMNPGHAGFEFYDVAPEGALKPLARRLSPDWEAEGKVPDMPGFVFRSRRMIRAMGHMLFPRYIQREARDFFYLTSRSTLPGPAIAPPLASETAAAGEGAWRTKGLPQHGFPFALATTSLSLPGEGAPATASGSGGAALPLQLRIVRADPRTMAPADRAPAGAPVVLALAAPARGPRTLWWSRGLFSIGPTGEGAGPSPDAVPLAEGFPLGDPRARGPRAAAGIQGEDGMLVWIELAPDSSPGAAATAAMDAELARLGCAERFALAGDARALPGDAFDAAGQPLPQPPAASARLVRVHAPDAHPVFEDTPIVPIQVWQPLQMKRVRYFLKPTPPPAASAIRSGSSETPSLGTGTGSPVPTTVPPALPRATPTGAGAAGRRPPDSLAHDTAGR